MFARRLAVAAPLAVAAAAAVLAQPGRPAQEPPPIPPRDPTAITSTPSAQNQPRSARNASYTITARLDPASRTLIGDELLTWRNTASIPATSLRFHLYYNAWRNTRSSWMREADPLRRRQNRRSSGIRLGLDRHHEPQARRNGRRAGRRHVEPQVPRSRRRQPRRSNGRGAPAAHGDRARADHQRPDRVVIQRFRARSRGRASSATITSSPSGSRRSASSKTPGGTAHQFHAATEFFADFGVYDVRLTVPAGWIVGATGVERGRRDNGDGRPRIATPGGRPRFRLDDEP